MKYFCNAKRLWTILIAAMLLSAGSGAQAPAQSTARTYKVMTANIPFPFLVGDRKFDAGNYQFVLLGPGLLAVLNTQTRVFARVITRDSKLSEAPASTSLNFTNGGKRYRRLNAVLLGGHERALEVVGEEAARQNPPQAPPMPVELFGGRGKLPLRK